MNTIIYHLLILATMYIRYFIFTVDFIRYMRYQFFVTYPETFPHMLATSSLSSNSYLRTTLCIMTCIPYCLVLKTD